MQSFVYCSIARREMQGLLRIRGVLRKNPRAKGEKKPSARGKGLPAGGGRCVLCEKGAFSYFSMASSGAFSAGRRLKSKSAGAVEAAGFDAVRPGPPTISMRRKEEVLQTFAPHQP